MKARFSPLRRGPQLGLTTMTIVKRKSNKSAKVVSLAEDGIETISNATTEENSGSSSSLPAKLHEFQESIHDSFESGKKWLDEHGVRWSINRVGNSIPEVFTKKFELKTFEWVPHFLQDNSHILSGYRSYFNWKLALKSIFKLHNETGNIHTHLIGFLTFFVMWVFVMLNLSETTDRIVFSVFILAAVKCLFSSTCFHTFLCCSEERYKTLSCLDFSGISILIGGSIFAVAFYMFTPAPGWRLIYCALATVFTVIIAFASFRNHTPTGRAILYIMFGCSGVIPMIHWFFMIDSKVEYTVLKYIAYILGMGVSYLVGAYIYAQQIPEKWSPGVFDIWGNSHQIFHCCVVTAAFFHLKALMYVYTWAQQFHLVASARAC